MSTVQNIFIDSLKHSFIPSAWNNSTGLFFHKPTKPHYLATSWRSNSLSSSLLKLLEKSIYLYLQHNLDIENRLNDQQLGFRKNRSTDEALHKLISSIELVTSKGQFELGCFIDIKTAFDSISFKSILKALQDKGIPQLIIDWITNLLGSRKVIYTLRGSALIRYMIKGTPQGGVLSPLLWNLVIDYLITSLQHFISNSEIAQGFADDIAAVILGSSLPSLLERMQLIVSHIKAWCDENELELSPDKSKLVLFTHKRKFHLHTPIMIGDTPLHYTKDVRYLGVILDHKLKWNKHIQQVTNKANKSTMTATRTIGKSWGLTPQTARWIYNSITIPRVSYASHVWGLNPSSAISHRLYKVQNQAARMIIHCPKYTSRKTMEITAGIPPLTEKVKERATSILFRLNVLGRSTTVTNTRTSFRPHSQIFHDKTSELGNTWDITTSTTLIAPKFNTTVADATLISELKQHLQHLKPFHIACFTDGSHINDRTGAAAVLYDVSTTDTITELQWKLHHSNSVFQAELMAIKESCSFLLSTNPVGKSICILTDSLASVHSLTATSSNRPSVLDTRTALDLLSDVASVHIFWIRGHSGIPGNERADHLAKSATTSGTPLSIPLPTSVLKSILSTDTYSSRTDAISESLSSNPLLSLLAHYAHTDFLDFFSSLNRRNLRIITSFLDNKAPLKKFLHHIGLTTDSLCDLCSEPDQDNAHILYSCPALILQRLNILGSYTITPNSSPPHPQLLLDFLLSTSTYSCYAPLHEQ